MRSTALLLSLAASFTLPVLAGRLPLQRRDTPSSSQGIATIRIANENNILYFANITVAGEDFLVQVDTGSIDLWVLPKTPLKNAQVSKAQPTEEVYGSGSASGSILFGPFSVGPYNVQSQAFLNVTNYTDFDNTIFAYGGQGIMGISFDIFNFSKIVTSVAEAYDNNTALGQSPIANIFDQNPYMSNFITIYLSRSGDLENTAPGAITIGEYLQGYENINKMPHVPQYVPPGAKERWSALVDGITVNGKAVSGSSSQQGVPPGKLVAVFDTGASIASVPGWLSDAIYSSIPNAFFSQSQNAWIVPCNATVDVRFKLGDQEIPIHPLDVTLFNVAQANNGGNLSFCTSAFSPLDIGIPGFDILLGDTFLRNSYILFDFGNVSASGEVTKTPYMQFLPLTTDLAAAAKDFNDSRSRALAQAPEDNLNDLRQTFNASSSIASSGSSLAASLSGGAASYSDGDWSTLLGRLDKYGPVVIGLLAGNLVIGLVLAVVGLAACIRGGKSVGASRAVSASYAPVRIRDEPRLADDEIYVPGKYSD